MFAYCLNNPVNGVDSSGNAYEDAFIKGAGVGFGVPVDWSKAVNGVRDFLISLGLISATVAVAINDQPLAGDGIPNTKSHSVPQSASLVNSIEDVLAGAAGNYSIGKCKEAAEELQKILTRNKLHGYVITIQYSGLGGRSNRNYVYSDIRGITVSENGFHCGVCFNGIVYCNIHPFGLPEDVWINDFVGFGIRTVAKIPF